MQVSFQLYIKARDSDAGLIVDLINSDDDLDDIFIDRTLEVSSNFTELEVYVHWRAQQSHHSDEISSNMSAGLLWSRLQYILCCPK